MFVVYITRLPTHWLQYVTALLLVYIECSRRFSCLLANVYIGKLSFSDHRLVRAALKFQTSEIRRYSYSNRKRLFTDNLWSICFDLLKLTAEAQRVRGSEFAKTNCWNPATSFGLSKRQRLVTICDLSIGRCRSSFFSVAFRTSGAFEDPRKARNTFNLNRLSAEWPSITAENHKYIYEAHFGFLQRV